MKNQISIHKNTRNIFFIFTILCLSSFEDKHKISNYNRKLEIDNYSTFYEFLKSNDTSYISIIMDGVKVNIKSGLHFDNDSFINRIASCGNLETLKLANCHLKEFPIKILRMKKLSSLYLGVNEIDSIPFSINQLSSLENIDMEYNRLRNIDFLNTGKCELPKLKYIYFDHNLIEKIPEKINVYQNLQTLFLSDNRITTIPCALSELDYIRVDISSDYYKVDSLPCCFNRPYKDFSLVVNFKEKKLSKCFAVVKKFPDSSIYINNKRIEFK